MTKTFKAIKENIKYLTSKICKAKKELKKKKNKRFREGRKRRLALPL